MYGLHVISVWLWKMRKWCRWGNYLKSMKILKPWKTWQLNRKIAWELEIRNSHSCKSLKRRMWTYRTNDQKRSILLSLSQTIVLFFLKYLILFYLTSNFCISNALASIKPISLSIYPTLNYSLLTLDHNILSNIAFAVRNFVILFGYSLIWFGHWIVNVIYLQVWMKNAFPYSNYHQLYYSSYFRLFFYFYFCFNVS